MSDSGVATDVVVTRDGQRIERELTEEERLEREAFHAANLLEVEAAQIERTAQEELARIVTNYLQSLAENESLLVNGIAALKGPNPPSTIAALRTYVTAMAEMTLDHNRGIDQLIRYLVRTGVIG